MNHHHSINLDKRKSLAFKCDTWHWKFNALIVYVFLSSSDKENVFEMVWIYTPHTTASLGNMKNIIVLISISIPDLCCLFTARPMWNLVNLMINCSYLYFLLFVTVSFLGIITACIFLIDNGKAWIGDGLAECVCIILSLELSILEWMRVPKWRRGSVV